MAGGQNFILCPVQCMLPVIQVYIPGAATGKQQGQPPSPYLQSASLLPGP